MAGDDTPPVDPRTRLKRMVENGQAKIQPLSFSQRELWEASPVLPNDTANHICTSIDVRGAITPEDCDAAIQGVVNRQEALRTSFLPGKTQPLQIIRSEGKPAVINRDLPADQQTPEALEKVLQEIFHRPFNLLHGPLYRVEVLRRGPESMVLVFAIHHAIADGWSLGAFVHDLCAAYIQTLIGLPGNLPNVPQTYTDWAAAERTHWQPSRLAACADYWKSHLAGSTRLWPDSEAPRRLNRTRTELSASVTSAVRGLARRVDATLFSTLLTGFQIALARWTGKTDILVGTPVANRAKQSAHETMGYFSGNVPIRSQVDLQRPAEESVRAVHHTAIDAFAHAMPFAEMIRVVNDPPRADHNPVFDVRFALQNHPVPDVDVPGLSLHLRMHSTGTARFDLGCEITETGDQLEVVWLAREGLFSVADVAAVDQLFRTALTEITHSDLIAA